MAVMTGAGRLGGRGVAVAEVPITAPAGPHPLIIPFRLASVLAAQLFDFGTFTIMVARHGIGSEANPLVAQGFSVFGMPMVALMKIVLVVLLTSVIVILARDRSVARSHPTMAGLIAVLAVAAGLVGGISNVIAS
jgi:Domain of unknown function (DUF5658)